MIVENKLKIYSIGGKDTVVGEAQTLNVSNVWNKDKFVEIQIGDGLRVVVLSTDLIKAISNATNNEKP